MHTQDIDISINKISKIEGHADLDIKVRDGKVEDVSFRVAENRRFYEETVKGKPALQAPGLVSRICGTCSLAHMTACTEAVEKTLGIKVSEQTLLLKKLAMYALMIRDHALHLYYFSLPDVFDADSALDLLETKEGKELVHDSLHMKEAGNKLAKLIVGRSVHPTYEVVGGFSHFPSKEKIPPMIEELKSIKESVIRLAEIYYNCNWKLDRDTNFVALKTDDFSFLEGKICSTEGAVIEEADFWDHLHTTVIPYSRAKGFKFEGREYMVGALSRLNLNKDALHAETKKSMKKYLDVFPSINVYHHNLAQVIEIMHSIDHAIEILENNEFKPEDVVKPPTMTGKGVGAIEAPRGTLYYWIKIIEGKVEYVNLVIPSAQNLINIKRDLRKMVIEKLEEGEGKDVIKKEAEKIIRAYDPCMSCASHFLKVNWI